MSRIRNLLLGFFATLLMIAVAVHAASAQDNNEWSAWLYNQESGSFIQVSPTGETLQQIDVPHTSGYDWYGYYAAVSPDGQTVAYGEATSSDDMSNFPAEITLYDVNDDQLVMTYPLNSSAQSLNMSMELFNAATSSLTFNEASTSVVFGYPFRYDPSNLDAYHWEIVAVDYTEAAPAPSYILDSVNASAQLGTQPDALYNIIDLEYTGSTVQFTLEPVFVGQGLSAVTAAWDTQTGEVNVIEDAASVSGDVTDTANDLSLVMQAETSQADEGDVMGDASYISVTLVDGAGNQQPLYAIDAGILLMATFVQNGERVALYSVGDNADTAELLILELDGTIVQTFGDIPLSELWSTPDGFLYQDQETQQLIAVNLRMDGERSTLVDGMTGVFSIAVVATES